MWTVCAGNSKERWVSILDSTFLFLDSKLFRFDSTFWLDSTLKLCWFVLLGSISQSLVGLYQLSQWLLLLGCVCVSIDLPMARLAFVWYFLFGIRNARTYLKMKEVVVIFVEATKHVADVTTAVYKYIGLSYIQTNVVRRRELTETITA